MKLKMVKGGTYMCPPLLGQQAIQRGDVIDVADDVAAKLLKASYRDGLDNEHHYFVVDSAAPVTPPAQDSDEEEADDEADLPAGDNEEPEDSPKAEPTKTRARKSK